MEFISVKLKARWLCWNIWGNTEELVELNTFKRNLGRLKSVKCTLLTAAVNEEVKKLISSKTRRPENDRLMAFGG